MARTKIGLSFDPGRSWKLPPLILHPFSEPDGPARLIQGSRAGLILNGLLHENELSPSQLEQQLLDGRYCELMMLFYIGKDILRWAGQCVEVSERCAELRSAGIRRESFVDLLIEDPPRKVDEKLRDWGVYQYKRIFTRAVGLHAIFESVPQRESLAEDFVCSYHRFADQLFACRRQLFPYARLASANFDFELFASGEYSRLLEQQWGEE